ncbi:MAG: Asp23/Gls24 family envelope stress response protein [Christensenellaceae bacterium]|jgi:uncharacterized alkaline shock family protein YloU|nr:Asp23/Gls24 family envelope stress response protein [Christensenellaceae bacterium]
MKKHYDTFENGVYVGETVFETGFLHSAIKIAASEVPGVAYVGAKFGKDFRYKLRNLSALKDGVKITKRPMGTTIAVSIAITNGYSVADVSYRVQESVLEACLGFGLNKKRIRGINVRICAVDVPGAKSTNGTKGA